MLTDEPGKVTKLTGPNSVSNPGVATPYDTGERLEPQPWVSNTDLARERAGLTKDADRFGRVDFDNDEGRTVLTVWVERTELGGYAMYVLEHDGGELDVIHRGAAETLDRLREEG